MSGAFRQAVKKVHQFTTTLHLELRANKLIVLINIMRVSLINIVHAKINLSSSSISSASSIHVVLSRDLLINFDCQQLAVKTANNIAIKFGHQLLDGRQ